MQRRVFGSGIIIKGVRDNILYSYGKAVYIQ
jgi:hypothetical protein